MIPEPIDSVPTVDLTKFRTFLLTSLDNYVVDQMRREVARKRGGPSSAQRIGRTLEPVAEAGPEHAFEVKWAQQTLAEALRRMESECHASGRDDCWGIFEARILAPSLDQIEPLPYEVLVERYQLRSPAQASNLLITAKRTFVRALRSVIAAYTREEDLEEELCELLATLSTRA